MRVLFAICYVLCAMLANVLLRDWRKDGLLTRQAAAETYDLRWDDGTLIIYFFYSTGHVALVAVYVYVSKTKRSFHSRMQIYTDIHTYIHTYNHTEHRNFSIHSTFSVPCSCSALLHSRRYYCGSSPLLMVLALLGLLVLLALLVSVLADHQTRHTDTAR